MANRRARLIGAAALVALMPMIAASPGAGASVASDAKSERVDRAHRGAELTRDSVDLFLGEPGGLLDPDQTTPERAGELLRGLARESVPRIRDAKDAKASKQADRATAELIEAADAVEAGDIAAARAHITNAISALDAVIDRLSGLRSIPPVPIVGVAMGFPEPEGIDFEPSESTFRGWFDASQIAGEITRGGKLSVPGANCRGTSGSTFRFHTGTWDPLRGIGWGMFDHSSFFDPAKGVDPDCEALPNDLVERGTFVLQIDPGTGELRGLFSTPRPGGLFTGVLVGSFDPDLALDVLDPPASVVVRRSGNGGPATICGTDEAVADRTPDLGDLRISFGLDGLTRSLALGYGDSLDALEIPFGVLVREQMADGSEMAMRIRIGARGETTVDALDPVTAEPTDGGVPVEVDLDGVDLTLTYESPSPPTAITVDTAAERADGTRVCDTATISTDPPSLPDAGDAAEVEQYRRHLDLRLLLDSYRAARRLQRSTAGNATDRARVLRVFADGVQRDALASNDPTLFGHARTAADAWRDAADEFESGDQSRGRALLNDGLDALDRAIDRLDEVIEQTRPLGTEPFEVPDFRPCGGTCTEGADAPAG